MSYTKRIISTISLLLTILIFSFLILLNLYMSLLYKNFNNENSEVVYSKVIPLNQGLNKISKHKSITCEKNGEVKNAKANMKVQHEKNDTQRSIITQNKTNKWRIQIPKIGLDAHINEGTSLDVMLKSVGHFTETSKWNGNVGLAAHNRGYQCNFFEKIKKLKNGDEIIYCTPEGKRIYKVQTNKVILETDWSYLEKSNSNKITLITCEENRAEYRRCIQAMQVAEILK